jgi:hypothetical protein
MLFLIYVIYLSKNLFDDTFILKTYHLDILFFLYRL